MTSEINGKITKDLNYTIAFHSNELSTSELIEYFNGQAIVEFTESNYLYLQIKLDFLMICYTANNINGTYRSFKPKQAGLLQKGMDILLLLL